MRDVPDIERQEVQSVLSGWGYKGDELEMMTKHLESNPKAMLEFMMAFELKLSPIEVGEARRSFAVVFSSTVFGSFVPLVPFFFITSGSIGTGTIVSVVVSGALLFITGVYEARVTVGSLWRSGLQLAIIGLSAGFAGYLIGRLIGAVPV